MSESKGLEGVGVRPPVWADGPSLVDSIVDLDSIDVKRLQFIDSSHGVCIYDRVWGTWGTLWGVGESDATSARPETVSGLIAALHQLSRQVDDGAVSCVKFGDDTALDASLEETKGGSGGGGLTPESSERSISRDDSTLSPKAGSLESPVIDMTPLTLYCMEEKGLIGAIFIGPCSAKQADQTKELATTLLRLLFGVFEERVRDTIKALSADILRTAAAEGKARVDEILRFFSGFDRVTDKVDRRVLLSPKDIRLPSLSESTSEDIREGHVKVELHM